MNAIADTPKDRFPKVASPGWAVVTGASSGIGRAFALELARRGHPVLLVARRRERLVQVADTILRDGGRADIVVADLATADGMEVAAGAAAALGDIDVLVNNAGVGSYGRFVDRPVGDETAQIALNTAAVVTLTRRLLPRMLARRRGQIINVASILAFMPTPYFATYAATKAFVLHFSEALGHELRGTGVRVLAACPGVVKTEFASVAGAEAQGGALPQLTPEAVVRVALRAADDGRVVRVIGPLYRLLALLVAITPRALVPRIMGTLFAPRASESGASRTLLVALGAWFGAALLGGALDIFDTPGGQPLGLGLFIAAPIVGFIAAYRLSAPLRRTLERIPLWALTLAHIWRFVGVGFVLAAIAGRLPAQFGYPEGIGDIIAAAAAIPLAFLLARRPNSPHLRAYYVAWNIFGLIDLVSAITVGILYSPSALGILRETISTQPLTKLPVNLIPSFFVPLFILTHLLGLRRSSEVGVDHEASAASRRMAPDGTPMKHLNARLNAASD